MWSSGTGISLNTEFFVMGFLYFFFSPTVVIDGKPEKVKWGRPFFPVSSGDHSIGIFVRYIHPKEIGRASATVSVTEGSATAMTYRAPKFASPRGNLSAG